MAAINRLAALTLSVSVLLPACGTFEIGLETETPAAPQPAARLTAPPNAIATFDEAAAGGGPDPAGLLYVLAPRKQLVQVDGDGNLVRLSERGDAVIAPDGGQLLFVEAADVWLADLATGQRRNLTNTPDRIETAPRWWPARPGWIAFSSHARDQAVGPGPAVFPTVMQLDGTGYQVLTEDDDQRGFDLAPDGQTLAYGAGPTGWLHALDTGQRRVLDPRAFGYQPRNAVARWTIAWPAWSPDGTKLAWTLAEVLADGHTQVSGAVIDLAAGTFQALHPYWLAGGAGQPGAPQWSPDGQWLVMHVHSDNIGEGGLWALRVDGGEERYLGNLYGAHWSPDGRWLAASYNTPDNQALTYALQLGQWDLTQLPRPRDAQLAGWAPAH